MEKLNNIHRSYILHFLAFMIHNWLHVFCCFRSLLRLSDFWTQETHLVPLLKRFNKTITPSVVFIKLSFYFSCSNCWSWCTSFYWDWRGLKWDFLWSCFTRRMCDCLFGTASIIVYGFCGNASFLCWMPVLVIII